MTPGAAVPTLDWILAGLLLLSVLVGIWRGLVFEVLSLAGWFVSYAATRQWGNLLAPWMPGSIQGEALRLAVANLTCFLLVLLVWGWLRV